MSRLAPAPSRQVLAQAGFQLWLVNVLVGTGVGTAWLFDSPADLSPWVRAYVAVALVSSVAILALLPGALFLAIRRFVRSWPWVGRLQALVGTLFLGVLYTDTIIYRLLRYHFNGAVLNVALTPGSEDAVHLGWSVWGTVVICCSVGTVVQLLLWHGIVAWLARREAVGLRPPLLLQPRVVCLVFLLPAVGIEKSVYAAADIQGDWELMQASKPLPLLPRVRLGRVLDPERVGLPRLTVQPPQSHLAYPRAAVQVPPDGARPNLFMLLLDSWRRDAFTPELTPHLAEFARGARVFTDHASGGNGTRYGLFTMLYGLHGSYWTRVLEARRSPVLVDTLVDQGYDVRVFSAASMNFPEFLSTAWVGLPREQVVDRFPDSPAYVKDELVAQAFERWMDQRRASGEQRPFFCFVLLDAPHQPYDNPGGPHQPSLSRPLDYIELGRTTEGPELDSLVERVRNTYWNCVRHADRTAGRLLAALDASGELERTVVLVTGDHGEEFHENGYWGHTSNFSREQIEVPFVLRGPGVVPGLETRPTSHLDVSNSLLELLGADPASRGDYSLGESLFDPPADRGRVMAGWADLGLWTDAGVFLVPFDVRAREIEVFDLGWNALSDVRERCRAQEGALRRMARECVRFLRAPAGG